MNDKITVHKPQIRLDSVYIAGSASIGAFSNYRLSQTEEIDLTEKQITIHISQTNTSGVLRCPRLKVVIEHHIPLAALLGNDPSLFIIISKCKNHESVL